ncbi:MAG: iron-containing alcohol dehydrogenase [Candidatus Aenigmatarchaeota archaeon]
MDVGELLRERGIEIEYLEEPKYHKTHALGRTLITNEDAFTVSLLEGEGIEEFHRVSVASLETAEKIAESHPSGEVVGFGGGKAIDVAKMVAKLTKSSLVSAPTAPSHDGLISKNCSLHDGGGRKTYPAVYPRRLIIPLYIWKTAGNLRLAGLCDIISNIVALEDISLAESRGAKTSEFYRELSRGAVKKALEMKTDRDLAEALVMSGIAMENGSEYCSGSEHEAERLLEGKMNGKYLHGQLAGTGTLISAKVYSLYADRLPKGLARDPKKLFDDVCGAMRKVGALDYAITPLKDPQFRPEWLKSVSSVRPGRHTLWNEIDSEKIDWRPVIEAILEASPGE